MDKFAEVSGKGIFLADIHSRGYLPHVEGAEYQVITYRLADSLPKEAAKQLAEQYRDNDKKRLAYECYLDVGHGSCLLQRSEIAEAIVENWRFFDGKRYRLIAYVVMPNHVHLMIQVIEGQRLSNIVHGWKSFTSKKIKQILSSTDPLLMSAAERVWQPDYWDRYIRNEAHYLKAIDYIHQNPVKAGLVAQPGQWPWSSVYRN